MKRGYPLLRATSVTTYLVIGLLLLILGVYLIRSRKPRLAPPGTVKPVAFLQEPENDSGGWHDVRFNYTVEQMGPRRTFHLKNNFEGGELGLDVEVEGPIQTALEDDGQGQMHIVPGNVKHPRFVRAGDSSDRFVEVLDRLYQTKLGCRHMVNSFAFDAIPLEGEEHGLAKIKLFGNPEGKEGEYFELYLNIDFREGWAEIAEKDTDYRLPMMKALCARR